MAKKILWLDDYRNPNEWMDYVKMVCPILVKEPCVIVWVKSYDEFVEYITNRGLPDAIGFDHDLADEGLNEKTGYDAAKFFVDYCIENDAKLPEFGSQSANPAGRENILNLLNNFKRHVQRKD
jgi:hypothetical protein